MNTRPTPETDKFFATFADGEAEPSHAEYYARLQDLERERDEAREYADRLDVAGIHSCHSECQKPNCVLRRKLTDVTAHRNRLAEEVGQLKSRLTQTMGAVTISRNGYVEELEQQRDRLAVALKEIYNVSSFDYATMPESARKKYREVVLVMADEALQSLTTKP
jgi:hypothetical protein